jgi:cytochrome P450
VTIIPPGPGHREASRLLYTVAPLHPLDFVTRLNARYGDTARMPFPWRKSLYLLSRPEHAEHILATGQDNYVKPRTNGPLRALLGTGSLLASEGADWRRHRRMIQPLFSRRQVAGFAPRMTDGALRLLDRWDALGDGATVNASAQMCSLTLDVVGRVLFSADLGIEAAGIGQALAKAQRAIVLAQVIPVTWGPRSTKAVLAATRGFGGAVSELREPVRRLVASRGCPSQSRDLLDLLLAAWGEDDSPLSESEILDETLTFMLAGHETTANALSWTLALLAANPSAREHMEEELAVVLGDRVPDASDAENLPWTRAVISEALRLYPPVWVIERDAVADDEVAGVVVRSGSTVAVSPYLVHRHPEFWPDPGGFDPRRFLPGSPERLRYSYIPFGGGRRGCVGIAFAELEATLLLATIARRYRLDLTPLGFPVPNAGITLRPGRTLPMRLTRRALPVVAGHADESPVLGGVLGDVVTGFWPPLGYPDQAGVHEREALAEPGNLVTRPDGQVSRGAAVVDAFERGCQARPFVTAGVADDQVAAGCERVAEFGDDAPRLFVVGDEVQHRDQQHGDGLGEVHQQLGFGVADDLGRLPQVTLDDGGVGVVGQHEPAVGDDDIVVVDVDDARAGGRALGDLVDVVLRGDAGADVEELADAGRSRQVPHRAAEEGPGGAHGGADIRIQCDHRAGQVPVGLEVMVAADPVVIHAGDIRLGGVDLWRYPARIDRHRFSHPEAPAWHSRVQGNAG